jgi:hypothetical protein
MPEANRFSTFYFSCSDGIGNKDELLQRLINTATGFDVHAALPHLLDSRKLTTKINLKIFAHEIEESFASSNSAEKFRSLSIEEQFELIINKVVEKNNSKVLFIVDELDRLKDGKGLASVIKNLSSSEVKFLLVGVGQNISTLLHDHASLERTLIQIQISGMRDDDCAGIIHKAELLLGKAGLSFSFSEGAIKRVVDAAGGFPWFVHTIAQEYLKIAFENESQEVKEKEVGLAVGKLSSKRFGQQFYDTYQMAVGDSRQREIVLRLFAKWNDSDLPTSELYPLANDLGVTNPASLAKQLMQLQYGKVLVRPPYAASGVFRFTNAMFKRYVNLRNSVYAEVSERVASVWEGHWARVRAATVK